MKPVARRHHYLPQAYLAGFTDSGTKKGRCFVLAVNNGRCFTTTPENIAVEKDFNRVEIEGEHPDTLEREFAQLEGYAARAIRNTSDSGTFPTNEDYNYILNLICLIAVRNPHLRRTFDHFREQEARIIAELVSDKALFESTVKKARKAGVVLPSDVSFEQARRFIQGGEYDIALSRAGNLLAELQSFDLVLRLLSRRTWSVLFAPSDGPDFVCSDHPVSLAWKDHAMSGPIGYGLSNTAAFFPLNRKIGFYGVFEDPWPPTLRVSEHKVAEMNTRLVMNAERHVFVPAETFLLVHGGSLCEVRCAPAA